VDSSTTSGNSDIIETQVSLLLPGDVLTEKQLREQISTNLLGNEETPLAKWLGSRFQSSGLWVHIPPSGPVSM
jgi:hypothetical protein